MRSNDVNREGIRQSNIYDDYDFVGEEGKTYDENYETVDDDGRYQKRIVPPAYTVMTAGPYKYNYTDKNVYDDCAGYELQQTSHPIPSDDSYVVMKQN